MYEYEVIIYNCKSKDGRLLELKIMYIQHLNYLVQDFDRLANPVADELLKYKANIYNYSSDSRVAGRVANPAAGEQLQ